VLQVATRKTLQVRTEQSVRRLEIEDPRICETLQFAPGEVSIVGKLPGETRLAVWTAGTSDPEIWCVRVGAETSGTAERQSDATLRRLVSEMFPQSRIKLISHDDKLIVEGFAKDRQEAVQILSFVRGVRLIPVVDRVTVRGK
jgi:Flp pilus assembly secretin CpaC